MVKIEIYNVDAVSIESISTENDATIAEVVSALIQAIEDNGIDISEYL